MGRRILASAVLLCSASLAGAFSASSLCSQSSARPSQSPTTLRSLTRHDDHDVIPASAGFSAQSPAYARRDVLARTAASILGASSLGLYPHQALAAGSSSKAGNDEGMVSQTKLASLLKQIPTFAIVDQRGVPYFVVGEDAKLTSYFFISYEEAKRILGVAISSSDKAIRETKKEIKAKKGVLTKEDEEEIGTNPWKGARITSVPMDLAVSLASKGKLAGAYFRLAPSESDIEDALEIDGTDDLPEGKVPLFYFEDMTIASGIEPLYFQKDQLIAEWQQQQKKAEYVDSVASPPIKVTELFATITEMARPGGTDEELKSLQFIAPTNSKAKAEKATKGEKEPFRLGERLIVL